MDKIVDFWEYKNNNNLSIDELISIAKEYFIEDFIENPKKWKINLNDINDMMKSSINKHVTNINDWVDMNFDYFCSNIIKIIEDWIKINSDIEPIDIKNITQKLINDYINLQLNLMNNKKNTIVNLMESIKKTYIDFRY
jgi:hypothetical protein